MREILFRGKRLDNGEWVEGLLSQTTVIAENKPAYVAFSIDKIIEKPFDGGWYEVDPATVGQYTGLTDKNGKRIFEGDIVAHYNNTCDPTSYEIGKIFWDNRNSCFKRTSMPSSVFVSSRCRYEVIGNIHDNSELLEGGVNDG